MDIVLAAKFTFGSVTIWLASSKAASLSEISPVFWIDMLKPITALCIAGCYLENQFRAWF